jgi:hypothetical protein
MAAISHWKLLGTNYYCRLYDTVARAILYPLPINCYAWRTSKRGCSYRSFRVPLCTKIERLVSLQTDHLPSLQCSGSMILQLVGKLGLLRQSCGYDAIVASLHTQAVSLLCSTSAHLGGCRRPHHVAALCSRQRLSDKRWQHKR